MREIEGILYCNDGDWVESLTALVETLDGELRIVHWHEIVAATQDVESRPAPANWPEAREVALAGDGQGHRECAS